MNKFWFSLLSRIRSAINKRIGASLVTTTSSNVTYGDGRETTDTPYTRYYSDHIIRARNELDKAWNYTFLDERRIGTIKTTDMLEILKDVSPDFNRALHDFVQFVVTSHKFAIHDPSADPTLRQTTSSVNQSAIVENGKAILNDALQKMRDKNESFGVKLEKAAASIFLHGAIFSEVVLDLQGRAFSDFIIIDATLADFQLSNDPVDGEVYRLGQDRGGQFIDLHDDPTVDYIAFDAVAGSPVGRSLSSAAIFPLVFSLMLLSDLRRQVIRTQAYPFKFASLDRKYLVESDIKKKEDQDRIIQNESAKLKAFLQQPAGPYVDTPIGGAEWDIKTIEGMSTATLSNVNILMQVIERQIVRALKTYSIIFGINSASGLSDNSGVQSELHYIFINSIQTKVEDWIESAFTEILRAQGNPGIVEFKLERINTLVSKQRSEIQKTNAEIFKIYNDGGAISPQEMRDLLRSPDPFGEISIILPEEVPEDAQPRPNEIIEVEEETEEDNEENSDE